MNESKLTKIIENGAIAAIYFLLTFFNPFSFTVVQIRLAEILTLLCFFRKDFVFGVTLGCVLSNISSKLGIFDIFIGGGATLLCSLFCAYCSPKLLFGVLFTTLINGLVIGWEYFYFLEFPFLETSLIIGLCELISLLIGYIFLFLMKKNKTFYKIIRANNNLDWKW